MAQAFDLIVIGAGTGGYVAAIRAAQLGLKTAVVERQKALGGTCLLWGCIPTKALLEHAHALKIVQHAADWGIGLGGATPALDVTAVHARKDKIVTGLTKGIESLFKKHGIAWIKGTARLAGQGQGRGQRRRGPGAHREAHHRRHRVLAAQRARHHRSTTTRVITSDEAIHLKEVPGSIVIMGSGAVGVEFASIFNRFGSKVTLIELLPRLVPVEDEAVSAELARSFKKQGIADAGRHQGDQGRSEGQQRHARRAGRRRQVAVDHRRLPAGGDRSRSGHRRSGRRRRWGWSCCAAT